MNIIYICDDNYAAISGVAIHSLLENNKDVDIITIYIIDGGISESNRNKLSQMTENYDRKVCFLTADNPEDVFGIKLKIRTWSCSNFYRLCLEKILPASVDKALYIDSDTLVTDELSTLYSMDINNAAIAATYDCAPTPKYDLGLEISDKYYSDGILLLNLKKIREEGIFDRFKECLIKFGGSVSYSEQGVINYVLRNEILLMPAKYNVMTLSLLFNKIPTLFFSKRDPYLYEE